MKYIFRLFLLSILTLYSVGCQTGEESVPLQSYSELPELHVDLVNEFGEGDNYYPAMPSELLLLDDGSLVLSDHGSTTIEHFSSDGEHLGTIAREGQGPGELNPYFFMYQFSGSVFAARQQMSNRIDLFIQENSGEISYSHSVQPDRNAFVWGDLLPFGDAEIMAVEERDWFDEDSQVDPSDEYHQAGVDILDFDLNLLQGTVHEIQHPNPWVQRSETGGVSIFRIPFRHRDRILPRSDGYYWIARSSAQQFELYNPDHELENRFSIHAEPRAVGEEDLELRLGNIPGERRTQIESRVPSNKPAFSDAWADRESILLQVDRNQDERIYVLLDSNGTFSGRFALPSSVWIRHFADDRIIAFKRDSEVGPTIRVYQVDR